MCLAVFGLDATTRVGAQRELSRACALAVPPEEATMDEFRTYADELGQRPRPSAHQPPLNWRAAVAGALIALAAQVALMMLGAAVGMSLFTNTASHTVARGAGLFTSIWSLLSLVAGAFAGGVIAGMCARGRSRYHGLLEGTMAWAIGLLGALAFVWRGLSTLFPVDGLPIAQRLLANEAAVGTQYGLVYEVQHVPALWTLFGAVVLSLLASVLGSLIAASARDDVPAGWGRISQVPPDAIGPSRRRGKIHVHGPKPAET